MHYGRRGAMAVLTFVGARATRGLYIGCFYSHRFAAAKATKARDKDQPGEPTEEYR